MVAGEENSLNVREGLVVELVVPDFFRLTRRDVGDHEG